jgi:hypothetical protein
MFIGKYIPKTGAEDELNLLKSEKKHKVGIKIKRQMAGWDNDYLLKVLQIF